MTGRPATATIKPHIKQYRNNHNPNFTQLLATLTEEIGKRRTFAIISHPDAGKTTLTEKLLLFGGAIHIAGAVKSNKIKKTATSDWMEIEKQRGISVATSVMGFNYGDYKSTSSTPPVTRTLPRILTAPLPRSIP